MKRTQPGPATRHFSGSAAARACLNSVPAHHQQLVEAGAVRSRRNAPAQSPPQRRQPPWQGGCPRCSDKRRARAQPGAAQLTPDARRLSQPRSPRARKTLGRRQVRENADVCPPPPPAGSRDPGGPQPHLWGQPSLPDSPARN